MLSRYVQRWQNIKGNESLGYWHKQHKIRNTPTLQEFPRSHTYNLIISIENNLFIIIIITLLVLPLKGVLIGMLNDIKKYYEFS